MIFLFRNTGRWKLGTGNRTFALKFHTRCLEFMGIKKQFNRFILKGSHGIDNEYQKQEKIVQNAVLLIFLFLLVFLLIASVFVNAMVSIQEGKVAAGRFAFYQGGQLFMIGLLTLFIRWQRKAKGLGVMITAYWCGTFFIASQGIGLHLSSLFFLFQLVMLALPFITTHPRNRRYRYYAHINSLGGAVVMLLTFAYHFFWPPLFPVPGA